MREQELSLEYASSTDNHRCKFNHLQSLSSGYNQNCKYVHKDCINQNTCSYSMRLIDKKKIVYIIYYYLFICKLFSLLRCDMLYFLVHLGGMLFFVLYSHLIVVSLYMCVLCATFFTSTFCE